MLQEKGIDNLRAVLNILNVSLLILTSSAGKGEPLVGLVLWLFRVFFRFFWIEMKIYLALSKFFKKPNPKILCAQSPTQSQLTIHRTFFFSNHNPPPTQSPLFFSFLAHSNLYPTKNHHLLRFLEIFDPVQIQLRQHCLRYGHHHGCCCSVAQPH